MADAASESSMKKAATPARMSRPKRTSRIVRARFMPRSWVLDLPGGSREGRSLRGMPRPGPGPLQGGRALLRGERPRERVALAQRRRVSTLGGEAVPGIGPDRVLLHPAAVPMHRAELRLRRSEALLGRACEPLRRLGRILRHSLTLEVEEPEVGLDRKSVV